MKISKAKNQAEAEEPSISCTDIGWKACLYSSGAGQFPTAATVSAKKRSPEFNSSISFFPIFWFKSQHPCGFWSLRQEFFVMARFVKFCTNLHSCDMVLE